MCLMELTIHRNKIFVNTLNMVLLVMFSFIMMNIPTAMVSAQNNMQLSPNFNNGFGNSNSHKTFYLFTQELRFNETKLGVPHDVYTPTTFTVNKGDMVTYISIILMVMEKDTLLPLMHLIT